MKPTANNQQRTNDKESMKTEPPRILTIGVYGSTKESFFAALQNANVDTFCDIRQRRGVRGSDYIYANSKRLQEHLAELGIRYLHFKELAPSRAVREQQYAVDKETKTGKRNRSQLSPEFIAAYGQECLAHFDPHHFLEQLPEDAKVVVLFCVEKDAEACHRSLVAARLHQAVGAEVGHLISEDS